MSFFISEAAAQDVAGQPAAADPMVTILMMVGLFAFMYFFMIRPQRKRQKEHKDLMTELSKGDEIVMVSGMLGKVVKAEGDYMIVEVGANTELKFQKMAVHAVLPKGTIKGI